MSKLGQGAFGDAYLVHSKMTGQLWVIKKVNLNELAYEERVTAREEAKILEVLNHPNIIKFKDVFKDNNLFLVFHRKAKNFINLFCLNSARVNRVDIKWYGNSFIFFIEYFYDSFL